MFFINDIIKGLLIRKYFNEFREVYKSKKKRKEMLNGFEEQRFRRTELRLR